MMSQDIEATIAYLMQPFQANIGGDIHGGEIMKLIDNAAGAVALRYSGGRVVTARVDEVQFIYPIKVGMHVTFKAKLAYVGNSSMEITVAAYAEDLTKGDGSHKAVTAFVTMVAMNDDGSLKKLEPLVIKDDEMRALHEEMEQRRAGRHRRRG
jgi:acyl-CoA hydrolase